MVVDSGVSLEENTITFPEIEIETISSNPEISDNMIEGCVEMDLIFRLPNASYSQATINFEIVTGPGYATNGIDYVGIDGGPIDPFVTFEEGEDSVSIHIIPILDGEIEGNELIDFIIENDLGCEIRYDTVSLLIQGYSAMVDTISPPTVTCEGCPVDLWVNVYNGWPPYSYLWEPGGATNDTITVNFEEPGLYTYEVTVTDMCQDTLTD